MMHQVVMQLMSSHLKKNPRGDNDSKASQLVCLLHLIKKLRNDNKPPGSLSFVTPEKKIKEMTMSQGTCCHLLHLRKKTRVKKKQSKKKVDVHLLGTYALVIFWKIVFCNTILATSSTTPLQHRSCSIASTSPLQHCLLQQHFNSTSTSLL